MTDFLEVIFQDAFRVTLKFNLDDSDMCILDKGEVLPVKGNERSVQTAIVGAQTATSHKDLSNWLAITEQTVGSRYNVEVSRIGETIIYTTTITLEKGV